jgi:hypothetical protein
MQSTSLARTRWAAIGAAVALTLGAGGISFVNAAVTSGERTVFVPITPCRLFDTRPEFQVGPKSSPLGANEVHSVPGVGTVGNCTLPSDAVALALNVTAIDATLPTFLAVWPAGQERPVASSLNPAPGQPPTPNAVTTNLGANDEFSIYNLQGTVNVFADAVGYYADHNHDDRYLTKEQTVDALDEKANVTDVYSKSELDARVPGSDSISLAGGAFASRDAPIELSSGSACFQPGNTASGMRHSIPVTTGSTITALGVRARNTSIYEQQFTLTLFAQRPGSIAGDAVHTATLTIPQGASLFESRIDLPTPERADHGEALYVAFVPSNSSSSLCAVTVEFNRPR